MKLSHKQGKLSCLSSERKVPPDTASESILERKLQLTFQMRAPNEEICRDILPRYLEFLVQIVIINPQLQTLKVAAQGNVQSTEVLKQTMSLCQYSFENAHNM